MNSPIDDILGICRNVFDMIEFHCHIFIVDPPRRELSLKRVMFYLGLLSPESIQDFGRLYNRLEIVNFIHALDNILSWTEEDWDNQINKLLDIKKNICRNDATVTIIPHIIMTPDDSPKHSKHDDFKDMYSKLICTETIDHINKDETENFAHTAKVQSKFARLEMLMRIQPALQMFRKQIEVVVIHEELLNKLKASVTKCLESDTGHELEHLCNIDNFIKEYKEVRTKEDEDEDDDFERELTPDFELWENFEDKHFYSLDDMTNLLEDLLKTCYVILPTPDLVELKYGLPKAQKVTPPKGTAMVNRVEHQVFLGPSPHWLRTNLPSAGQMHPLPVNMVNPANGSSIMRLNNVVEEVNTRAAFRTNSCKRTVCQLEFDGSDQKEYGTVIGKKKKKKRKRKQTKKITQTQLQMKKQKQKPKSKWTEEEDDALLEGLKHFGLSNWIRIKMMFPEQLKSRTNVNIKDRYRTLNKKGNIMLNDLGRKEKTP